MRAFVFLLVVANLAFFAWTQGYLGSQENPDAVRLTQQLAAEKMIVLSRDEPPTRKPAAPVEKKPVQEKCLAWANLNASAADRIEEVLTEKFAGLRRARHVIPEASSWWVFIPPQASKADADKKAQELKRMGAPEFFVIQEPGPNRFAISLGIFSSESAAEERLEALRAKGVKSAKFARRTVLRPEQITLEATGPEPMIDAARDAVQAQFAEQKTAACGKE